jgi:hypothetical protein
VPFSGALGVRLSIDVVGQVELAAHVVDDNRWYIREFGEGARPLVALEQHDEGQEVLIVLRPSGLPSFIRCRGERLGQLARRHNSVEPRVRGPVDRCQPDTPVMITTVTVKP